MQELLFQFLDLRYRINYNKEVKIDYKKKYSLEPARKYESAEELREALKSYRTSMSQKENVKPYMVFTNDIFCLTCHHPVQCVHTTSIPNFIIT